MISTDQPLLDVAQAAFISSAVIITVAARNAQNVASGCIAAGRRLSPDRRRLTILVSPGRAGSLVDDVRSNGAIAVVCCLPTTHQTLQIKGSDAVVEPIAAGDDSLHQRYADALVPQIIAVGASEEHARAVTAPVDAMVAITFTPSAAFLQTPGPRAGQPVAGGDIPGAHG